MLFGLIVVAACILAVVIGSFFNIYVVLTLAVFLCFLFWNDGRRPNTLPGTSGKMGAMIMALVVLAPFITIMVITSIIVNWGLVASFFQTIVHHFSIVFLR